ncbi:hypothetical protein [Salinactinospora qingdaonensis]|uniref:hypothetical protein n=1 Tax=Salinactinospora qingdaonensis TaxID=702744 RepID=UPI0031EFF297
MLLLVVLTLVVMLVAAVVGTWLLWRGSAPEPVTAPTSAESQRDTERSPPASSSPTSDAPPPSEPAEETGSYAGTIPAAVAGDWTGEMTQYGPQGEVVSSWTLTLHLPEGQQEASGTLDIGNGVCEWEMTVTEVTDGAVSYDYTTVSDPQGICVAAGLVTTKLDDSGELATNVKVSWGTEGMSTAQGTLARVS